MLPNPHRLSIKPSLQPFRMDTSLTLLQSPPQILNVHPRRKNNRNALHGMQAERMSLSEEAKLVRDVFITFECHNQQ